MNAFDVTVPARDELRVVKATSVAKCGKQFFMKLHNSDVIQPIQLLQMPARQIKTWGPDEAMIVATATGNVIFHAHTFNGPVYLVTRCADPSTGRVRNVRVTFFTYADVEFDEAAHQAKLREREAEEREAAKVAPVINEKPVRQEGESFGKFQARLRVWKKEQAEVAA